MATGIAMKHGQFARVMSADIDESVPVSRKKILSVDDGQPICGDTITCKLTLDTAKELKLTIKVAEVAHNPIEFYSKVSFQPTKKSGAETVRTALKSTFRASNQGLLVCH